MRKKILSFILCSSMILSNSLLAFADISATTSGQQNVTVGGEIISTFEVLLPSAVTLQAGQSEIDFNVTVTANTCIGDEEILSVVPEEVIYLTKNEDEEMVQALIYQDKTKFYGNELGNEDVITTCTIETGKLSSGVYDGILKFNIELTADTAIIVDGTPRSWNWLIYNDYFNIEDGVLSKGSADLSTLSGTLTLSNKVTTIDTKAFEGSSIDTVILGESVQTINDAAFMSADSLTSIEVVESNSVFKSIDGVLFSADGSKLLAYPAGNPAIDYKIASNVTEIGNYAFAYCTNIASLTIPDTVVKTGQGSFTDMSIISSKYLDIVTSSYNINTINPDYVNTDTGSILLAKRVNGYLTQFWVTLYSLDPNANSDGHFAHRFYVKDKFYLKSDTKYRRIIFKDNYYTNAMLLTLSNTYNYITAIDGDKVTLDVYNGVNVYDSGSFNYSMTKKFFLLMLDSEWLGDRGHSEYCLNGDVSADEIICNNIVFSDIDVYDSNNNLIYKADITK